MTGAPVSQADKPKRKRDRGEGTVCRKGRSPYWWIALNVNGVRYQESSKSTKKGDANTLLKQRHAEVLAGKFVGVHADKTGFSDLVALLEADYQRRQRKSLDRALRCIAHLREFFGRVPALAINFALGERYVKHRFDEKAAHATVRQELAILGRMLNLAVRAGKLANRPPLPLVEVRNTRTGYFST